jgi:hypothetical protein
LSEPADLLHNSGWGPRASIVWNGFEPKSIWSVAGAGGERRRPAWQTLRFDLDQPPVQPGQCSGLAAADPAAALLQLLGVAPGERPGAALTALIDQRIRELRLPPVIPVEPVIPPAELARPEAQAADLLTLVALQAKTAGRLLVRDGDTRLSRIEHRLADGPTAGIARYQWPLRLHLDPGLADRLRNFRPARKGWFGQ